ncbi:hypothetical protein [Micromonospora sediminimaris]|uniref:Uncharacterized protein n=1 Tax=Micromonospora sediminimaris TaxID=547162 RepID=A0A9W5UTZ0_9ACTN|nr:hypothetical protein [Micromonospora sediminimaris]GIJ34539.1 hypothetical protein Vse01_36870 [Micromonospora sediminimaris]SFD40114.1 hypothetical protein SAMN05216284_11653 [Micromonospora sediminimaris]
MDEQDFWVRLEFRICAEFRGFEDRHLRWYWCDGLVADLRGRTMLVSPPVG